MTRPTERLYRFDSAAHWSAGARQNLTIDGTGLVVPDELAVRPIPATGPIDGESLAAFDAEGRLTWLRPDSCALLRSPARPGEGLTVLGSLRLTNRPLRMVSRPSLIWVMTDARLERFRRATLQRLSPVELDDDWTALDLVGAEHDGAWLLGHDGSGTTSLRSVDCWGNRAHPPIELEDLRSIGLSAASTEDGRWIVVIDPVASTVAQVVDVEQRVVTSIELDEVHHGRPTMLTVSGERMYLLTSDGGPDGTAVLEALSLVGAVEDRQLLRLPESLGRPRSLASTSAPWGNGTGLAMVAACGLAEIVVEPSATEPRVSIFITPTLRSPEVQGPEWNRAEVDVVLPPGTTLQVSWASTDSTILADEVDRLLGGPATADLVEDIDRLLRWHDGAVTYAGVSDGLDELAGSDGLSVESLAVLLDQIEHPILWLRLQFETPPSRVPPSLAGLRVRYPDVSPLSDLPAIYRDDPRAARQLRRLIAPSEILFDELDEVLASLPGRIDPTTATDEWSAYLLGWLGFPPLADLPAPQRRALLDHGSELLDLRGTAEGLRLVLDLVTGGRATVTDSGDRPAGWVLPAPGETTERAGIGSGASGLGHDTVALAQRPAPARPGTLRLGSTPIGPGCPDPTLVLAEGATVVTVLLELSPEERAVLEPAIERLLALFVPAHCRLEVIHSGSDGADRTRRLDVDFRLGPEEPGVSRTLGDGTEPTAAPADEPFDALLYSDAHWRLGSTSRAGRWTLPQPPYPPLELDHRARLGAGPRLH